MSNLKLTKIKPAQKSCTPYAAKLLNCRVCLGLPSGSNDKCIQNAGLPKIVPATATPEMVPSTPSEMVLATPLEDVPSTASMAVPTAAPKVVPAAAAEIVPSTSFMDDDFDDFADITSIPLDDFEYNF
ncbi:hypothetical protein BGW39_011358 [Mortierella sp. 14UC]|nr:hypothetical protein BGW39_011358 [Mortierella sp. 14UC]